MSPKPLDASQISPPKEHILYPSPFCWMLPTHSLSENVFFFEPSRLVGGSSHPPLQGPSRTRSTHTGKNRNAMGQAPPLPGFPTLRTSPVPGVEQVTRAQTSRMTAGVEAAGDASHRGQRHYHNTGWLGRSRRRVLRGS